MEVRRPVFLRLLSIPLQHTTIAQTPNSGILFGEKDEGHSSHTVTLSTHLIKAYDLMDNQINPFQIPFIKG